MTGPQPKKVTFYEIVICAFVGTLAAAIIIVLVFVGYNIWTMLDRESAEACTAKGGHLLRTPLGYDCFEVQPIFTRHH